MRRYSVAISALLGAAACPGRWRLRRRHVASSRRSPVGDFDAGPTSFLQRERRRGDAFAMRPRQPLGQRVTTAVPPAVLRRRATAGTVLAWKTLAGLPQRNARRCRQRETKGHDREPTETATGKQAGGDHAQFVKFGRQDPQCSLAYQHCPCSPGLCTPTSAARGMIAGGRKRARDRTQSGVRGPPAQEGARAGGPLFNHHRSGRSGESREQLG